VTATSAPLPDRRVRRNRRQLQQALVDLVLERPYDELTIDLIAERADVARATFYAHFKDKDALLASVTEQLVEELTAEVVPLAIQGALPVRAEAAIALYDHAARHRSLWLALLGGAGNGRPLHRLADLLADAAQRVFEYRIEQAEVTPRMPVEAQARAWVGEFLALLRWWLESGPESTPEEMGRLHVELGLYGHAWVEGFEPGELRLDESPRPA
jgi:AcrR family transcriptional regulator